MLCLCWHPWYWHDWKQYIAIKVTGLVTDCDYKKTSVKTMKLKCVKFLPGSCNI